MQRESQQSRLFLVACLSSALMGAAVPSALPQTMTVDQVIEKNIDARGGLKAWHEIQSMTMTGKMDVGSKQDVQLPFVLKLKRPRMSRLELDVAGKKALQIYDGTNGWKVRPFLGRNEVEPYTTAEMHDAAAQTDFDGYLIDHEAKGIRAELMGVDSVEGRDAYRLKLTLGNGQVRHLWVDAQSFLEVKIEGSPRRLDGKMHKVEIYYHDYASISGLRIPFVMETALEKVKPTRKMTIETVVLNPKLEDDAFAKPDLPGVNILTTPQKGSTQVLPGSVNAKDGSGAKNP